MYIYIYMCVCVCMCMCVKDKKILVFPDYNQMFIIFQIIKYHTIFINMLSLRAILMQINSKICVFTVYYILLFFYFLLLYFIYS